MFRAARPMPAPDHKREFLSVLQPVRPWTSAERWKQTKMKGIKAGKRNSNVFVPFRLIIPIKIEAGRDAI